MAPEMSAKKAWYRLCGIAQIVSQRIIMTAKHASEAERFSKPFMANQATGYAGGDDYVFIVLG